MYRIKQKLGCVCMRNDLEGERRKRIDSAYYAAPEKSGATEKTLPASHAALTALVALIMVWLVVSYLL